MFGYKMTLKGKWNVNMFFFCLTYSVTTQKRKSAKSSCIFPQIKKVTKRGIQWMREWPRTTSRTGGLLCGVWGKKKCSSCLRQLHTSFSEHLIYYDPSSPNGSPRYTFILWGIIEMPSSLTYSACVLAPAVKKCVMCFDFNVGGKT